MLFDYYHCLLILQLQTSYNHSLYLDEVCLAFDFYTVQDVLMSGESQDT